MTTPSHNRPSYVDQLLAAEREAPRPSPEAERRVRARVTASLVAGATGATGLAASTVHAAAATGIAVKTGGLAALGAKVSVVVLGVGVLGTAGVVSYQHRAASQARARSARTALAPPAAVFPRPRRVAPAPVPHPSDLLAADTTTEGTAAPSAPATSPPVPRAAPVRPAPAAVAVPMAVAAPGSPGGTLANESLLIEGARARIGEGKPARALVLLVRHAQQFPRGQLVEEREALWVQALVQEGATAEARERAMQFERRFPQSIQRDSVRAVVPSIP